MEPGALAASLWVAGGATVGSEAGANTVEVGGTVVDWYGSWKVRSTHPRISIYFLALLFQSAEMKWILPSRSDPISVAQPPLNRFRSTSFERRGGWRY